MSWVSAAVLALSAVSAGMQAKAGQESAIQAKASGEYGAQIYEQQAGMIGEQGRLENEKYTRAIAQMRGKGVAATAGKGLLLSGSPLAMMIDTETQMNLDQAIADYNNKIQKNYTLSGANYMRTTGKELARTAQTTGYTNAFTTILGGVSTFAMSNMSAPKGTAAPASSTSSYNYMNKPSWPRTLRG